MKSSAKKTALIILIVLVLAAIGIQFIPVERSNPPTTAPLVADAAVLDVLRTSCYDCHSNETTWPWYSYVAPVFWLVANDVKEGRKQFNLSLWENLSASDRARIAEKMLKEVEEGQMPLPMYLRMHPQARPSAEGIAAIKLWAGSFGPANGGNPSTDET